MSETITTPVAINTSSLSGSIGSNFTIAGFDASYLGTKKEKGEKLSDIYSDSFIDDNSDGTNLGSAGIPAFMTISGELKVIGLSTSVAGEPFTGPATYTRVYSDSSWINDVIDSFGDS